jgi:hypothetical protein
MHAEILGLAAGRFEVQPEMRPDGSWAPPGRVTFTMRPCWQKPPILMTVEYLYTNEATQTAYYAEVKK